MFRRGISINLFRGDFLKVENDLFHFTFRISIIILNKLNVQCEPLSLMV